MQKGDIWDDVDTAPSEAIELRSADPVEDEYRYSFGLTRVSGSTEWELLSPSVMRRIGTTSRALSDLRHFLGPDLEKVTWSRDIVDNPLGFKKYANADASELHYCNLYEGNPTGNHFDVICKYMKDHQAHVDVSLTYSKLRESRKKLLKAVDDIEEVADSLPGDFQQFQEFQKRVKNEIRSFKEILGRKFAFVIVGDMKCGKSSLINALLGEALMYVDINPATMYVCEIHNSGKTNNKKIETVDADGNILEEVDLNNLTPPKVIGTVSGILKCARDAKDEKSQGSREIPSLVRLHWPMPLLPDNIVLVDTPGVNEGQFFQTTVSRYLREQQQFCLCAVINATTAASENTTALIREFTDSITAACANASESGMEVDEMKANLMKNCLFILNRWDTLSERPPQRASDGEPFFRAFSTWTETFRRIEPILSELDLKGARVLQVDQLVPLSAKMAYYSKRLGFPSYHMWVLERSFSSLAVRTIRGELIGVSDRLQYLLQSFCDGCNRFIHGSEPDERDKTCEKVNMQLRELDRKLGSSDVYFEGFFEGLVYRLRTLLTSREKMEEVSILVAEDIMNECVINKDINSLSKEKLGGLISERLSDHLRTDCASITKTVLMEQVARELKFDDGSGGEAIRFELLAPVFASFASSVSRNICNEVKKMSLLRALMIFGSRTTSLFFNITVSMLVLGARLLESDERKEARKKRETEEKVQGVRKIIEKELKTMTSCFGEEWGEIQDVLSDEIQDMWTNSIWPKISTMIREERYALLATKEDLERKPSGEAVANCFPPLLTRLSKVMNELSESSLLGSVPSTCYIDSRSLKLDKMIGKGAFGAVFSGSFFPKGQGNLQMTIPVAVKVLFNFDSNTDPLRMLNELRITRTSYVLERHQEDDDPFMKFCKAFCCRKLAPREMFLGDWNPSVDYAANLQTTLIHLGGGMLKENASSEFWKSICSHFPPHERVDQVAYFVSPLMHSDVRGKYLIDTETITWENRLQACAKISASVANLHAQKLAHRDIKPENFLVYDTSGGENEKIVIADFGLTKAFHRTHETLCGTPPYFAPEQWEVMENKHKGVEQSKLLKADVYSTGIVLLEVLIGTRLVQRNSRFNSQNAINQLDRQFKSLGNDRNFPAIREMLLKAIEEENVNRCSSQELADFFASVAGEPSIERDDV